MKLLIISSESRGFKLTATPDVPPIEPGKSCIISTKIQGAPMVFCALRIGADSRVQALGPRGLQALSDAPDSAWRVDEVLIDGAPCPAVIRKLEASPYYQGRKCFVVYGSEPFGVGSEVVMHATNVDDAPAHFHATWELEDLQ